MTATPPLRKLAAGADYAVVNADLVLSRHLTDRVAVQRRLMKLAHTLNSSFKSKLAAPFMITLGDEIQGLLKESGDFPAIVSKVHGVFRPESVTIGVGIGGIATHLSPRVTEMDGPAFVRAREAVEVAKKKNYEVVIMSGSQPVDDIFNTIYALLGGIQRSWTTKQWERVNLYRELESIELVANKTGVTKQAISADLKHTLWDRIIEVETRLPAIFSYLASAALS